ncbi:MAG TPA: redoxin domain-containing protein [Gemmata sp.]|nr:redoxin domain-containing protein [Gemmata sp.]
MRSALGLTLWAGFAVSVQAQLPAVTAEGASQVMPIQPGVAVSTPPPNQIAQCKVEPIQNPTTKATMGFVVRDPSGKPIRQFVSYDGKNFNIRAFYLDGIESYREVFPLKPEDPVQFRWLGSNGCKWGYDHAHNGRIDEWIAISPEEVSQELLQAVITRDPKRAEALALTRNNLDALGFKGPESEKLLARSANIGRKVIEAADALKATPNAKWDHLELSAPQTTPADAIGALGDLVIYRSGTVLVKDGDNAKILMTGDLVQFGRTWKLVDGPGGNSSDSPSASSAVPQEIAPLIKILNDLDQVDASRLTVEALAAHNAKRVDILEQIVAKLPADKQETWQRLLVDALSAAAEGEKADGKYFTRLKLIKETLAKGPNAALAAFVVFRFLTTENNIAILQTQNISDVQDKWRASLEEFAKTYPNTEEAPEAVLRLAMAFEYQKDGEPKAKEWYAKLAQNYAKHPHAAKSLGAIKRLESEGKPFELVGPVLENGQVFNVSALSGNPVLVYYCANWSQTLAADTKQLQALAKQYEPKGLRIVTVLLDNEAKTAAATAGTYQIPGVHLFMPGGLDASPLASNYGVQVLPHLFIVGKDGKVLNRNAHFNTLEDDVKKLLP